MPEVNIGLVEEQNNKYIFYTSENTIAEVGDTHQVEFYPQLKMMKWNNEVNFSVRYSSDIINATYNKDAQDIITWISKEDVKVRVYENEKEFNFEFELPNKPDTNVFDMTIQNKGFTYHYQDEISDKDAQYLIDKLIETNQTMGLDLIIPSSLEEAKRIIRPENIVGSYAFYHESQRDGQYERTGKAFHIYRSKAINKDDMWVWCDLKIDFIKGILSVIVPQEFIDKSNYPVIINIKIGYSGIGESYRYLAYDGLSWYPISIKNTCRAMIKEDCISCDKSTLESIHNLIGTDDSL